MFYLKFCCECYFAYYRSNAIIFNKAFIYYRQEKEETERSLDDDRFGKDVSAEVEALNIDHVVDGERAC